MTTHELMEMASLDAMGLLDNDEREQFERAFMAADPALQAQIRRQQTRLSVSEETLPKVQLPLGLRARVLNAMRDAVSGNASQARPAAAALQLQKARGVSPMWRLGSMAALAACLVLGLTTTQLLREYRGVTDVQSNEAFQRHMAAEYGARFDQSFFDRNTQFVKFAPALDADEVRSGKATMLVDHAGRRAQLFVKDLPAAGEYEVIIVDKTGQETRALLRFDAPTSGFRAATVANVDLENAAKLLIRLQGSTKPLLTGGL